MGCQGCGSASSILHALKGLRAHTRESPRASRWSRAPQATGAHPARRSPLADRARRPRAAIVALLLLSQALEQGILQRRLICPAQLALPDHLPNVTPKADYTPVIPL